jgi:cysteine desulfurase
MKRPIYLDYNATTPVDERALARMLPFFTEQYGNASSKGHPLGWAAEEAVEQAREAVAALFQAEDGDIVFTSGATEAINTAIKGIAGAYARRGRHLVTVQTEHKAVLDTCRTLERQGFDVTYLPVQADGRLDPAVLDAALTDATILVAVMWANNETGVLQPIPELAALARGRGVLFMTDATQAVGKVPVDVAHVDVLTCTAHKIYGPKGVGALYLGRRNPRVRLVPLMDGGGQEHGLRGGTLNVPGIVGMGAALEVARAVMPEEAERLATLRDRFEAVLSDRLPDIQVNGQGAPRLPQTANITFRGVEAAKLVLALRDLAVSTGSACSSGTNRPSHVLKAMGLSDAAAAATIRFSLGRFTTDDQVGYALDQVIAAVEHLRKQSAFAKSEILQ